MPLVPVVAAGSDQLLATVSTSMNLGQGDRIRLPGESAFVTVDMAQHQSDGGVNLYVLDGGTPRRVELTAVAAGEVVVLSQDGAADPDRTLAALWSRWMLQAAESVSGTALGSAPLNDYLHQHDAVYGAMLPQPMLRFLLADEPGTGKTIMAGLYLTEASRLGIVNRALVVCPAHLVGKWQDDFSRFFGRELRRITGTRSASMRSRRVLIRGGSRRCTLRPTPSGRDVPAPIRAAPKPRRA